MGKASRRLPGGLRAWPLWGILALCMPGCGPPVAGLAGFHAGAPRSLNSAVPRLRLRGGRGDEATPGVLSPEVQRAEAVASVMSELFQQADAGNRTAMRLLGCCVSEGINRKCQDAVLAFRCYLSAAQQGDVHAQYNLGVCYATGTVLVMLLIRVSEGGLFLLRKRMS
jgi:TPR repeat protein